MKATTVHYSGQRATAKQRPPLDCEIVIDSFAGAGGWGRGEEEANGWAVDVAINHDPMAIETHKANHPATLHYQTDVFDVHPMTVEPGRRIAHCHFSPDCTHHSKARGGVPVSDRVRGLAWIVLAWAFHRSPRVITLENVEEFKDWGPTRDGKAIKSRKGETFAAFTAALSSGLSPDHAAMPEILRTLQGMVPIGELVKGLGYRFEHRELRACDYGAPTIRKRFFLVARCDDEAIAWPEPTHGPGRPEPYHTAAECIDWSLPCPSIFMTPAESKAWLEATGQRVIRPLKPNTLRRIANGVMRYVVNAAEPFIVQCNHGDSGGIRCRSTGEPMNTLTASRDAHGLVVPILTSTAYSKTTGREDRCSRPDAPISTLDTSNRQAVCAAFLARHYGGMVGRDMNKPLPTSTCRATQNQVVAAHLTQLRGTCRDGKPLDQPSPTLTAGGLHTGIVAANLIHNTTGHGGGAADEPLHTITTGGHAALIYSFLMSYYGASKEATGVRKPMPTITTRDRFGLVTVMVRGEPYVITDIGMRMLQPHELLRAQFGEMADGWVLMGNKTQQVAGIGNSVCPHVARAIVAANVRIRRVKTEAVA